MAGTPAAFESHRNAVLARLIELVETDQRLSALWLQGSLADGTADPLSDIDAYLAVEDADFEHIYSTRIHIIERLGRVLAWSDATTPGLRAVHCLLEGPVKLDLFFEPASAVEKQARPAVRVLVDKAGIEPRLQTDWQAPRATIARTVEVIVRMTRQGAAWPIRLLHRGQWSTVAMMELDLINAQIAQLMAVQHDPGHFYKNPFTLYRLLRPDQQVQIDTLTRLALIALGGRDLHALRDLHLQVFDALVREGRAACAALGVTYPIDAAADAAIRDFLLREWPSQAST